MKKVLLGLGVALLGILGIFWFQTRQSPIKYVSGNELVEKIQKGEQVNVIVGSKTCPHCHLFKPVAEQYAKDKHIQWHYLEISQASDWDVIDAHPDLFPIQGTPTVIRYDKGKIVNIASGEQKPNELDDFFKKGY